MVKTEEDIQHIREAGRRLAKILRTAARSIVPGVTTQQLNDLVQDLIEEGGDKPAFLGYQPAGAAYPYPAALCVSVNDEAVHGIPGDRVLKVGDIVSLDAGLVHEGRIADMCLTVPVESVDEKGQRLIEVTKKALNIGIAEAVGGAYVNDIGRAIEKYVEDEGFTVVAELGGHGVGLKVHEDPHVFHVAQKGNGVQLQPGMVITIEPTIAEGSGDIVLDADGYTYKTQDGSRTAQFEHTIVITNGDPEIVTVE